MKKEQDERVLVKDDSDLFQLIRRLTDEQPPIETWDIEHGAESVIQIELPFSVLLNIVDRLPMDKARLLYHRLEDRLANPAC
jgi:hypothetical protein